MSNRNRKNAFPHLIKVISTRIHATLYTTNLSFLKKKKDFIYLFLERGEGRAKERERIISVWLPLTWPHWGPGPQARHVPWLGIEPVTLCFAAHSQSTELHQPRHKSFPMSSVQHIWILQGDKSTVQKPAQPIKAATQKTGKSSSACSPQMSREHLL